MKFRHSFWSKGEPWNSIRFWLVPRLMRALHCCLMCSARLTISDLHRGTPYLDNPVETGALFVVWHDYTMLCLHLFRKKNVGVMMSRSRAGQLQAALWQLYDFPIIWGSTRKREGIKALREVVRRLQSGQSFAFTPDGPKGPRHYAQPGVIFMATHANTVVMPLGVASSHCWRLPTWDKHWIPKPFAHIHLHLGEPLHVPPNLDKAGIEEWRARLEEAMHCAQQEAEAQVNRLNLKA